MPHAFVEPLEVRTLLAAQLVLDIRPGPNNSEIQNLQAIGSTLYFSADNGSIGRELWVSNGTSGSTSPIQTRPGANGSNPGVVYDAGGEQWYSADTDTARPLFRISGLSAIPTDARDATGIVELNGKIYFGAFDKTNSVGYELYRMNPNGQSLELVKDLNPGIFSSLPRFMVKSGSKIFFAATSDVHGSELFSTDGVPESTFPDVHTTVLTNIAPGSTGSNPLPGTNRPRAFVTAGEWLYASADVPNIGRELVVVDTLSGLEIPVDLNTGAGHSSPDDLLAIGSRVFFTAHDGVARTLWVADEDQVTQLTTRSAFGLAAVGQTLFFASGTDLYKTNGTAGGTQLVKAGVAFSNLTAVGGHVFFNGFDQQHGFELWQSDGTAAGTIRVTDINPGIFGSDPNNIVGAGGKIYFTANDGVHGRELWSADPVDTQPPLDFAVLNNGGLAIVGTTGDDVITLVQSGTTLNVTRNGRTLPFNFSDVGFITIDALAGNDRVTFGPGIDIDADINGNQGNDTLIGGDGADDIGGGQGNDQLEGRSRGDTLRGALGDDILRGGKGFDSLFGGQNDDELFGGRGQDLILAGLGFDLLDGGAGFDYLITKDDFTLDLLNGGEGDDIGEIDIGLDLPTSVEVLL